MVQSLCLIRHSRENPEKLSYQTSKFVKPQMYTTGLGEKRPNFKEGTMIKSFHTNKVSHWSEFKLASVYWTHCNSGKTFTQNLHNWKLFKRFYIQFFRNHIMWKDNLI